MTSEMRELKATLKKIDTLAAKERAAKVEKDALINKALELSALVSDGELMTIPKAYGISTSSRVSWTDAVKDGVIPTDVVAVVKERYTKMTSSRRELATSTIIKNRAK